MDLVLEARRALRAGGSVCVGERRSRVYIWRRVDDQTTAGARALPPFAFNQLSTRFHVSAPPYAMYCASMTRQREPSLLSV